MMKRHALHSGMTVLTLSLLSSLTLLTACGGGGKGGPAAAAPAGDTTPVVVEPPKDPTVSDVTDPNEPYIVGASSVTKEDKSFVPVYQLNIIDGKTQTKVKTFSFDAPTDQQWITTKKVVRTLDTTGGGRQYLETEKGAHSLYVIMKEGAERQIFQIDLARGSDLKPKRISSISNACQITGMHVINKDGSDAAIYVKEAGTNKPCSDTAAQVDRVIRTDDSITTPSRTPLTTNSDIVAKLFKDGLLTGVMVKTQVQKTDAQGKPVVDGKGNPVMVGALHMLSPTLDKDLIKDAKAIEITSDISKTPTMSTFSTLSDYPLEGIEWIADAPGETNSGYFRLQQFSFDDVAYTNRLYKLTWDELKQTALVSEQPYVLAGGAISNKGLNDNKFIYFTNKDLVLYGPTATGQFDALATLKNYVGSVPTEKLVPAFQTNTHLVITQGNPVNAAFSIKKDPNLDKQEVISLFKNIGQKPQTILGIWGDYLIGKQRSDFDDIDPKATSLKRTDIRTGYAEFMNDLNRLNVLTPIWSATTKNGSRELLSAIVCPQTTSAHGDCSGSGEDFRTADFSKLTYGLTIGTLGSTLTSEASVKATETTLTVNSYFDVTRVVAGGLATYRDPWMFNPGLKKSLLIAQKIPTP